MIPYTLKVTGLKELREKLQRLPEIAQSRIILAAAKVAMEPMAHAAREECPRSGGEGERLLLGHMADSIQVFDLGKDSEYAPVGEGAAVCVSYSKAHFYGHMIEYGPIEHTREWKFHPFIRPAFETTRYEVLQDFGDEMKRRLERKLRGAE